MSKQFLKKISALVLALCVLLLAVPMSSFVLADDFVPQNVLRENVSATRCVQFYPSNHYVDDSTRIPEETMTYLTDGDTSTTKDCYGALDWDPQRYIGVEYTLDDSYYIGDLKIYSGYSELIDTFEVYASDSLDDLYNDESSLVASSVDCNGTAKTLTLNKTVKYVAFLISNYTYNARIAEFEAWTAEEESGSDPGESGFTPVNVLRENVSATRCVQFYPSNHYVDDSTRIPEETMTYLTDGDTSTTKDCYGALDWDPQRYIGVEYTLDDSYYIGDLKIYSGYSELIDTFEVYASDSLDDLYNDESSLVASSVDCNGTAKTLTLNKTVKYVAFLISNYTYNARIAEFEAWTAEEESGSDPGESGFTPVNVLRENVSATRCVQFYPSNHYVDDSTRIPEETMTYLTDGDTSTTKDCYGALDWDPQRYIGVEYTLDDSYYIGDLKIYSGYSELIDTFEVYASDSLDDLYNDESSLVASSVDCNGTAKTLTLNKTVKYVAFLISNYTYNARIAEFEAWTAEEESGSDPGESGFTPVNVMTDANAKAVAQYTDDGHVGEEEIINEAQLAGFTDGDKETHIDLNASLDWDPPRRIGAEYDLGEIKSISSIKLYAAIGEAYPEAYRVYASDSLETLYTDDCLLVSGAQTTGNVITVDVNSGIQYVAFFCESYTGNPRFKEIEAYTACDHTDTETPDWITNETNHWHECTVCKEKFDEAAHTYTWVITKEVTAEENGLMEKICSVCGYNSGESRAIDHIPGDVNKDGSVNNKDLTRLFQYLSDWDVEVNEAALDINGDGNVNNKDLTRLFQYLSDWDVEIY